jgi:hypothetical protein
MAGPIDIQKNCFYRKHTITSDGAIKLLPSLTDSALSGTRDFNVQGGVDANIYLLSGATPPALTYGDGQLIGGDLVLYCSGTQLSSSGAPPVVDLYAAVSGTTFTEGDMELSHGWENLTSQSGSVTSTTNVLNGTGTTFTSDFAVGDDIKIGEALYSVNVITNDTTLTLNATPAGGIAASANNLYKPRFYGNELAVYTAHADNDLYTYSENFDGGQSLGTISVPGFKVSNPYVLLNSDNAAKLASSLYAGGNYSLTYGLYQSITGEDAKPTGSAFFAEYFGTMEDMSRPETVVEVKPSSDSFIGRTLDSIAESRRAQSNTVVKSKKATVMYLKPLDDNKLDDLWVPANDFREGMENIFAFTPYWRWKDIKGVVQFRDREETSVEDAEDVNPNNTIFDSGLIYASPNISTFYGGGDKSGLPVNKSIIQISNEAYADGGSSLQMYNLWSYSKLNAYGTGSNQEGLDPMYGVSGAANPQFCCVGMKNVPFPQMIDNAFNVKGSSGAGENCAYDSVTLPEINIKFNVKEMDVNPTIASAATENQKDEQGVFTDYWGANMTAGTGVNRYSDVQYVSGTTDWELDGGPFDYQFRTLMRNFTICFSNYPPKEGEGLDTFIHRGLKNYYSGTTAGDKIIGGLTVFRDRSAMGNITSAGVSGSEFVKGDGNVLTAMPLQVANSDYAQGNAQSGYPNLVQDISNVRNRILKFNNCSGNTAQSADVMCFAGVPANDGNTENGTGVEGDIFEHSVNLSMDQFVNAKFVFNTMGLGGGGKINSAGAVANRGFHDQCRVYFTDGVIDSTEATTTENNNLLTAGTVEEPASMPIYFPVSTHNSTSGIGQTWIEQPKLWPRYMTLWVTNYRNTNYAQVSTDDLQAEAQPWTNYTGNKADFGITGDYPNNYGSDKQTNVFVDNIHFSNFTNAIHNASIKATGRTDNIVINQWPIKSPVGAPAVKGDYDVTQKSVLSNSIHDYKMPTYVIMGFDNGPADFFVSGVQGTDPADVGTTQWYQWHGFGTSSFSNLTKQHAPTTTHNMSWWKHSALAGLQRSYGNYLMNTKSAFVAYNSTYSTKSPGDAPYAIDYVQRGFLQTTPTFGATQPTVNSSEIFNFATGSATHLFTDGLTQKGFTQFGAKGDASGTDADNDYDGSWLKREHPFIAAKITKVPELFNEDEILEKGVIEVDRAAIFDMPLSDEFMIYTVGGGTGSLRSHAQIIAEGSAASPYWDYDLKSTTVVPSGTSIAATATTMDLTTTAANPYYDSGLQYSSIGWANYIKTGSFLAFYNTGTSAVDEIVRIENYEISGGATGYDRVIISRGQMGTSAAARTSSDYYIQPLINVYAVKGVTQRKGRDGNKIFLNIDNLEAIVNDDNLPYLYISPYKYWQWFMMWPGQVTDNKTYAAVMGTESGPKAYSAISLMKSGSSATTATGTTYSEDLYTFRANMTGSTGRQATYDSLWNLETATSGSSIVTNIDYGLGPYAEDTRTGGQVASTGAYPQEPIAFSLDGYVASTPLGNEYPVVHKLLLGSPLLSSSAVFYGNDYTTTTARAGISSGDTIIQEDVKPYYLWRYIDPVPTVSNFTVGAAFNLLDRETNLYDLTNENLNAVKFNWSESGEDIWYRMLIVDDKAVYSKYHGFVSNAPHPLLYGAMNEVPNDVTKPWNATPANSGFTLTFKETTTDSYGTTFAPTIGTGARMSPEGLQGYAFDASVSGASAISWPFTDSKGIYLSEKYTFIVHLTPGVYSGATNQTIFHRGTAGNGGLIIEMDNGIVKVNMGGLTTPLSSKTVSPRDGEQPMMIACVFDKYADVPCKLYINGKLEDYSITGTTAPSEGGGTTTYMCNNAAGNQPYVGLMEEFIIYGNVVHFPDDTGEFILDGSRYQEFSTDVQSLHAKLFVMDYHNIRGDGKDVLCSTPTISWRPTIG